MKVLHLSTSDIDQGAARAAYRLHMGLRRIGIDSKMLVRAKSSLDNNVIAEKTLKTKVGPLANGIPLKLYPKRDGDVFSTQWFPDALERQVKNINPDIINLHWVGNGFLRIESLKRFNRPLVWTLHDMWPFTGGCHYSKDCTLYEKGCGQCQHLNSKKPNDLSHWIWKRKARSWENLEINIVSPSQWLADCARASSLLQNQPIHVIPHGLDTQKYAPVEPRVAREILKLPIDKKLVLFGAFPGLAKGNRKGFEYLVPALKTLTDWQSKIELVIFGANTPEKQEKLPFPVHYLGKFADDVSLSLVYSSADVMVVPSIQEAFGQTATEALSCGTPVVAFKLTGLKDIVDHKKTGYLANPFDSLDLGKGIDWVLSDTNRYQEISENSRSKAVQKYSLEMQAQRFQALFKEILSDSQGMKDLQKFKSIQERST
jgi:glycosyltransferase involved in cell wall biosynthesis